MEVQQGKPQPPGRSGSEQAATRNPGLEKSSCFLGDLGLFVRRDGTWFNGWEHWTVLSPGPWGRASFTVKPGEDLASRALSAVAEFSPRFERRVDSARQPPQGAGLGTGRTSRGATRGNGAWR